MSEKIQNDEAYKALLKQQDALNAQMVPESLDEVANIAIFSENDRQAAELVLEQSRNAIAPIDDDPTVRAAVHALLMEQAGNSTDELDEYELPSAGCQSVETDTTERTLPSEHTLSPEQKEQLLSTLKVRFEANMKRHKGIEWAKVQARLNNEASPEQLWSLNEMQRTGGRPDVIEYIEETGEFEFWDCSDESPSERRNICYDREGQKEAERRGYKPFGNAVDMAAAMGLGGILDEKQYRKLRKFDDVDLRTLSWIDTPEGGAPVGSRRVRGAIFGYIGIDGIRMGECYPGVHFGGRAFRGWLRV